MFKRSREDGQLSKEDVFQSEASSTSSAGPFARADASTLSSRKMVVGQRPTKSEQAARHIMALNKSFTNWFRDQMAKNPSAELVNGVQDYIDYAKILEDRYLRRVGEVLTFGSGDCGQLAHGVDRDEDMMVKYPRVVHSLRNKKVYGISCGGLHNAVCTEAGQVFTWGCSDDGALGRGGDENMPGLIEGALTGEVVVQVACGDCQTIVVTSSGDVWGWGCYKDKEGKRFFNSADNSASGIKDLLRVQKEPMKIAGLKDIDGIACGASHNIARAADGSMYSWGIGESGELGRTVSTLRVDGEYEVKNIKVHMTPGLMMCQSGAGAFAAEEPISNVKNFGCGGYHSLVSVVGDKIYMCGLNNYGQLCLGGDDTAMRPILTEIPLLEGRGIVALTGGVHHSLLLTAAGELLTCGRGDSGQLGERATLEKAGHFSSTPVSPVLPEGSVFKSIACGGQHNLALTEQGEIYSWGYGDMLALGHGAEKDELVPRKMNFAKGQIPHLEVSQIAGGGQHSAIVGTVLQYSS